MSGFKDFILKGNLIELAVAFIIGTAFATVVTAFTDVVIEALAKAGGAPNFDDWQPGDFTTIGPFLSALVAFLILAFIVYFFIVKPYQAARARLGMTTDEADPVQTQIDLLTEIRDGVRR